MRRANVLTAKTAAEARKKAVDYARRVYKREGKTINANTLAMQAKVYYNDWARDTGHATTNKLKPFMNVAEKMGLRVANFSDMGGRKKNKRGQTMKKKRKTKRKKNQAAKKANKKKTAMVKASKKKAVTARKANPKKKAARKKNALLGKRKRTKKVARKPNQKGVKGMITTVGHAMLGSAKFAALSVLGWSMPGVTLAFGQEQMQKISANPTYQKAIPPINSGLNLLISGLIGYKYRTKKYVKKFVPPIILGTGARFLIDLAQAIVPYDPAPSKAFGSWTTLRTITGLPTQPITAIVVGKPEVKVTGVPEIKVEGPEVVTSTAARLLQGGLLKPSPTAEAGKMFGATKVAVWKESAKAFVDPSTQAVLTTATGAYVAEPAGYVLAVEPDMVDSNMLYPLVDKNGIPWMMYGDRPGVITAGHSQDALVAGYEIWSPEMGAWVPAMTDQVQGYEQWSPQMGAFDVGYQKNGVHGYEQWSPQMGAFEVGYQKPMGAFEVGYQQNGVHGEQTEGYEMWSPELGDFEVGYQMGGDNPLGDPF